MKEKLSAEHFLRRAISMARENARSGRGGPFAALVVKNGEIIGTGVNQVTTGNDPTAHAEMVAIRNACRMLGDFQLTGCEIYCSCEPCPMCLGAIYWARPDKVYFACTKEDAAAIDFDDHFIYTEIEKTREDRSIPFIQLLQEEGREAMKAWEENPDKIPY